MKVAILGAGPAGLMTAWAVERNGLEPIIYAGERKPSLVNEDMYLQCPLPDIPGHDPGKPDAVIDYIRVGTSGGYARKCYGNPYAHVSWEHIEWGQGNAWWLDDVYKKLYEHYLGSIVEKSIGYTNAPLLTSNYPLVISTIPAPALCGGGHTFESRPTWLVRWYSETLRDNEMVYNGEAEPSWYRSSRLRGWNTYEYAEEPPFKLEGTTIHEGQKFVRNNCTCNPKVHRVGRWAQWQRGVLNHHAFENATAILASVGLGKGA